MYIYCMPNANGRDPSLNMVQLLHSGRSLRENLLQGGWQPTLAMMLSSTHRAKLYSGDTSHRLEGRFSFSCLIAWHFASKNFDLSTRGGAAKLGFISITYHKYILGVHKYILMLEISTFDHENR